MLIRLNNPATCERCQRRAFTIQWSFYDSNRGCCNCEQQCYANPTEKTK